MGIKELLESQINRYTEELKSDEIQTDKNTYTRGLIKGQLISTECILKILIEEGIIE